MYRQRDIIEYVLDAVAWLAFVFLLAVVIRAAVRLELPPPYLVGIAIGVLLARVLHTIGKGDGGRWA